MRLSTRDGAQGGEFDVVASPAEGGGDTAIIAKYGGRNDVATCVATLRSGRDMVFMLRDEQESLINFLLPNDGAFLKLYDETTPEHGAKLILPACANTRTTRLLTFLGRAVDARSSARFIDVTHRSYRAPRRRLCRSNTCGVN
jgi:hypothetical protein